MEITIQIHQDTPESRECFLDAGFFYRIGIGFVREHL